VATKPASKPATYMAEGVVESIEPGEMTITHGPVPALKWPGMTMGFNKPKAGKAFADLKPGDKIHFEFRQAGDDWEIVSVHKMGSGQPAGARP
jgi:Cu(I)/Ag(I) efflux system membrane fusion protein